VLSTNHAPKVLPSDDPGFPGDRGEPKVLPELAYDIGTKYMHHFELDPKDHLRSNAFAGSYGRRATTGQA
jgi:hypothetical protein